MTKRIVAILTAVIILAVSVPAFAVSFSDWNSAGLYSGDLSTLSSVSDIYDSLLAFGIYDYQKISVVSESTQSGQLTCVVLATPQATYGSPSVTSGYFYNTSSGLTGRTYNQGTSAGSFYLYYIPISTSLSDGFNPVSSATWTRIASSNWAAGSSFKINTNLYATQHRFWIDQSVGPLVAGASFADELVQIPWPVPTYSGTVNFSLNPGNVLVFERSGGFTGLDPLPVSGTSLPKSLGWLEKTWSTGVTYGPSLAYPSTSTNLTENYLFWNKVPGTQNLWGITTSGTGSIPIQGPNDFFWIVNPIGVYRNSKWVNNPPITITFNPSDFDAVYLTPMINMDGMAYIPESFDPIYKKYKIDFNADTGDTSYTDTSTDTFVPSADANRPGGLNGYDDVEDGAIGETVGGILGILQSGARAIESLVNGARSFFEALSSMYDWLPDDVQTILKASLFLVFAVGVIKVLH